VGAMTVLLKDVLKPNLVQTLEHTPVIIHGGPFANIAHGCNSILATRYGLKLGDYLVTEAGFGADLGAEKFFDIKCRLANLKPDAVVLTTTIRSLKYNGGMDLKDVGANLVLARKGQTRNLSLRKGIANLEKHIENIKKYDVPVLVAINRFSNDTPEELNFVMEKCKTLGAKAEISEVWARGGKGGIKLAKKLLSILKMKKSNFKPLYDVNKSIPEKIETIAKEIYGASGVRFSKVAKDQMKKLEEEKLDKLPVCIAKTQYSLSDDPKLLGRPKNFMLNIREIRISNGAGFIVALAGEIMTMPGLPKIPAAEKIDIDEKGVIKGLF